MIALIASTLVGATLGLFVVPMYAIILRSFQERLWKQMLQALRNLIVTVLGGSFGDYAVFRFILRSEGLAYYLVGFAVVFIFYARGVLDEFLRRHR